MNGVFCGGFSFAMFDDRRVMIPGKLWPSLALSFFCAATHVRELIDPFVKEMSKSKSLSLGGASQHCMGPFFLHRQEHFREFRATLPWRSQWGWMYVYEKQLQSLSEKRDTRRKGREVKQRKVRYSFE